MIRATLVLLLLLIPLAGWGQFQDQGIRLYGFLAPGVQTAPKESTLQFGFGGDASFARRFRAGGEVGYVGRREKVFNSGLGVLSANLSLVIPTETKWTPYLTGGYTLFTDILSKAHGVNFGAGTDVRLSKRVGLRLELRDQIGRVGYTSRQFIGVRFGPVLTFQ